LVMVLALDLAMFSVDTVFHGSLPSRTCEAVGRHAVVAAAGRRVM